MRRALDVGSATKRYHRVVRVLSWAACALVVACGQGRTPARARAPHPAPVVAASAVATSTPVVGARPPSPLDECQRKITSLLATPPLPGAPELEARRAETFARA